MIKGIAIEENNLIYFDSSRMNVLQQHNAFIKIDAAISKYYKLKIPKEEKRFIIISLSLREVLQHCLSVNAFLTRTVKPEEY